MLPTIVTIKCLISYTLYCCSYCYYSIPVNLGTIYHVGLQCTSWEKTWKWLICKTAVKRPPLASPERFGWGQSVTHYQIAITRQSGASLGVGHKEIQMVKRGSEQYKFVLNPVQILYYVSTNCKIITLNFTKFVLIASDSHFTIFVITLRK